jgi:hypothetical protein
MNRNPIERRRAASLIAIAALIVTTVTASLLASARGSDDDARRVEKICVANGGHWERTGTGGACLDNREWLLE